MQSMRGACFPFRRYSSGFALTRLELAELVKSKINDPESVELMSVEEMQNFLQNDAGHEPVDHDMLISELKTEEQDIIDDETQIEHAFKFKEQSVHIEEHSITVEGKFGRIVTGALLDWGSTRPFFEMNINIFDGLERLVFYLSIIPTLC